MDYPNQRRELWDRINDLPDEILVTILSLLTLKEAGRTSVLSRRWRYLWTFFKGKMLFNEDERRMNWPQFVNQANQIMELHRAPSIQEFGVSFDHVSFVQEIEHWIEFAAKKKATKFRLTFEGKESRPHNKYSRIWSKLPCLNWSFESLKDVYLSNLNLKRAPLVDYFLLNCPNLEHLCLHYSKCLPKLLVPSSCLRLKELCLRRCRGLSKLEISAGSLELFHYEGPSIDIDTKGLHQLRQFWFRSPWDTLRTLPDLVAHLYKILPMDQLERLYLNIRKLRQERPLDVKQFGLPKLNYLCLIMAPRECEEMLSWMYLLEAAPLLHTLELRFYWGGGFINTFASFDISRMPVNRHVKVVKVVQFLGVPTVDACVVKNVTKYMKSLEKLIIVPYSDTARPRLPMLTDTMKKQMNDGIAQLCEKGFLPPGIDLVIKSPP